MQQCDVVVMVAKYEGLEDRDVYEINKEGGSSLNIVADCQEYYGNFKKIYVKKGLVLSGLIMIQAMMRKIAPKTI